MAQVQQFSSPSVVAWSHKDQTKRDYDRALEQANRVGERAPHGTLHVRPIKRPTMLWRSEIRPNAFDLA